MALALGATRASRYPGAGVGAAPSFQAPCPIQRRGARERRIRGGLACQCPSSPRSQPGERAPLKTLPRRWLPDTTALSPVARCLPNSPIYLVFALLECGILAEYDSVRRLATWIASSANSLNRTGLPLCSSAAARLSHRCLPDATLFPTTRCTRHHPPRRSCLAATEG